MRRRTFASMTVAAVVAPLAIACGDDITGPEGGQVLALQSVDGRPLPVTIEEAPGFVRTFQADTIRLGADDRWSRREVQDLDTPGEDPRRLDWSSDGTVERFEGAIVLSFVCNDTGSCIAPDRLIPESGGYRIERPTSEGILVLRYGAVAGDG